LPSIANRRPQEARAILRSLIEHKCAQGLRQGAIGG